MRVFLRDVSSRCAIASPQRRDAIAVEGPADIGVEDCHRLLNRHRAAVRPIGGERVEHVGDGDVLIGAAAVAAIMADALGTFESTLAKLSADTDPLASNGPIPAALCGPAPPKENATMPPPAAPQPVPTALDVEFERVGPDVRLSVAIVSALEWRAVARCKLVNGYADDC